MTESNTFRGIILALLTVVVVSNLYIIHERSVRSAELIGFIKGAGKCIPLNDLLIPPSPPTSATPRV